MALITISRGTMSGGLLVARHLGERFQAEVLDRQSLVASDAGLAAMEAVLREEIDTFPEYLWEELESLRRAYLATLRSALLDRAERGPLVYHANGGQLLLRHVPGVLRLRVVAPVARRVEMIDQRLGLKGAAATRYILEKDARRERWNRFLFGVRTLDADTAFDLVLNLEHLSPADAATLACQAALLPPFQRTAATAAALADAALAARVEAALARHANTRMLEAEVRARGGHVHIVTEVAVGPLAEEIRRVVGTVGGVQGLTLEGEA